MAERAKSIIDRISIPSHPRFLGKVRGMVEVSAEKTGFTRKEVHNIVLAVDEACTNIIRHAYSGDNTKKIDITCRRFHDRLEVTLRDYAKKPNLEKIKSRSLKEVRPGGLGVFFIKKIMDEALYDTSPRRGTKLKLVKYLPLPPRLDLRRKQQGKRKVS